jgi:hypothetical protein
MNRIVIIGNGFDKAHSLSTGYNDFMDYLVDSIATFEKVNRNSYKPNIKGKKCSNEDKRGYIHKVTEGGGEDNWIGARQVGTTLEFKLEPNSCYHIKSIYFKSLIDENSKLGYWSDLESHYFQTLYKHKESPNDILTINSEFEHLKKLLFEYLKTEVEDNVGYQNDYEIHETNPIYEMFKLGHNDFEFEKTYFITFNYTAKILNQYLMWLRKNGNEEKYPLYPIHIHGDLTNPNNPIVFGYGDENSPEYKELELLQNNKLLSNFKTFQYLRSNKYTEILGLLEESDENYIQIIGHSCGLCDKALLRTIFQHKSVKYIEPTYYNDESKYFENLYNISRIFDDNTLMREKIIPLSDTFKIG